MLLRGSCPTGPGLLRPARTDYLVTALKYVKAKEFLFKNGIGFHIGRPVGLRTNTPRNNNRWWLDALSAAGRLKPVTLPFLVKRGVESFAWLDDSASTSTILFHDFSKFVVWKHNTCILV